MPSTISTTKSTKKTEIDPALGAGHLGPTLTVMPLNYNGRSLLETCLPSWKEALAECSDSTALWLLDNASQDDSKTWLETNHPDVKWVGYSENKILAAYNEALASCDSPYVMIMNNDVKLKPMCLDPLLDLLKKDSRAFGVMPSIQADLPEERVQRRLSGRFFHGHLGHVPLNEGAGGTLYLHGAAMVVDRLKFLEIGGFDPLFFYQEDNDLSYRAWRRGWHCWFEPRSEVYHLGSQTTAKVHLGTIDRRAIKERASHFFIIKNIQSRLWLFNFLGWSVLKSLKMLITLDLGRAWAWRETFLALPKLWRSRKLEPAISDAEILKRVEALV